MELVGISWNNDYESLQNFLKCVFAQDGKWKSVGGSSKKFDSAIADFSCTWYPDKLNSLVFHGEVGILVNETLIAVCRSTSFNALENDIQILNIWDTSGMPKQSNSLHTQISEASLNLEPYV